MVLNPEFSIPGDVPADSFGWTRTTEAAGLFGAFLDAAGTRGASEPFSWVALRPSLAAQLAPFDARTGRARVYEDFEDLWGARNARLLSKKEAPFVLQPGQTLLVRVNGGDARAITFEARDFANIADARAEEIARVIDRAIDDADAFMAPGGRGVVIATTAAGVSAALEVAGGTAAPIFDFSAGEVRGQDEEGGTFYKRAEFDLMNDALTGAEFDNFERGYLDASVQGASGIAEIPDLRYDPFDRLLRFVFAPSNPFVPGAFLASLSTYTWAWAGGDQAEVFDAAQYPGETLTTNYV